MNKKKDFSLLNCIATGLLAIFLTVPFHEFLHFLTFYVYGDKVSIFSAGAVDQVGLIDPESLSTFGKIMYHGGSASIINAIIGIVLFVILIKAKKMKPMMRVFLTQLMGAQMVQGIGYFMLGGFFGVGDWGNVFAALEPGLATALQIILAIIGGAGVVGIFFALNYMSYYFIEDKDNRTERRNVAFKLHMTVLIFGVIIGLICSAISPMNATGELNLGIGLLFNMMWIPFFWAFMFTWVMVKPPKKSRFLYKLPEKLNVPLLIIAIILTLVDICWFGPGIKLHDKVSASDDHNGSSYEIKNNKEYSVGDLIRIKDMDWYVLEDSNKDSTAVRLISKYNLNPNINNDTRVDDVFLKSGYEMLFDENNSNKYDNSSIKNFLENVAKNVLENIFGIKIEGIGIWDYKDLEKLGCKVDWNSSVVDAGISDMVCDMSDYYTSLINSGVNSWVNAPRVSDTRYVWGILEDGIADYILANFLKFGVRPVITVDKSVF
ncbi:MAG: hypothetical protein Q4F58_02795 [Candidatus Saccharibacteria bacterium]|nr:hypothetical protein [Candidatus Saccharibacteria bacterium]